MKKCNDIVSTILSEIDASKFGKSGSRFPTVKEICNRYQISNKTALSVIARLKKQGALISVGDKNFILSGIAEQNSDLFHAIKTDKKYIGFHVCEIANEFISKIVELFSQIAQKHGYTVLISCSNNTISEELNQIENFIKMGCLGFVSFSRAYFSCENYFKRIPIPYVLSGSINKNLNTNFVTISNFVAGEQAAKCFMSLDYQTYCYIGNNPEKESRGQGFISYLQKNNVSEEKIHIIRYTALDYTQTLTDVIAKSSNSDRLAIFCYHDLIALSVYELVKKRKSIPEEVGIIGVDNLSVSQMLTPTLTTITYNFQDLADNIFKILNSNILDHTISPKNMELFSYLIIRKSVSAPNHLLQNN